jgi:hypothetical protein
MKLDDVLIQMIMVTAEGTLRPGVSIEIKIPGYDRDYVNAHVEAAAEMGLLDIVDCNSNKHACYLVNCIKDKGYDFIESWPKD